MKLPPCTSAGAFAIALALSILCQLPASAQLSIRLGPDRLLCGGEASADGKFGIQLAPQVSGNAAPVSVEWDASGPGDVDFTTGAGGVTTIVLGERGEYTIRAEVTEGEVTATDEVVLHAAPSAAVHWRLDEEEGSQVVADSSSVAADGTPTGPNWTRWNGPGNAWQTSAGRYGGALRPGGASAGLEDEKRIGNRAPFTAALWFNSVAMQDGAVIDMFPNAGEGIGWTLLITVDGAIELRVGHEHDYQTLSVPDAYAEDEWTHVAFTLQESDTHRGSTIAKLYVMRATDEPEVDSNPFSPPPLPDAITCFEETEIRCDAIAVVIGRPSDVRDNAADSTILIDDVRLFTHPLSAVEVQDVRVRRAPWRVNLFNSGLPHRWVIGSLGTADPNLCDVFHYQIVADSADAAAFQILDGNVLAITDSFVPEAGRTYCAEVRSTDDVGLSVVSEFCFDLVPATKLPPTPLPEPSSGGRNHVPGDISPPGGAAIDGGPWVSIPTGDLNPAANTPRVYHIEDTAIEPQPPGAVAPVATLVRRHGSEGSPLATFRVQDIATSSYAGGFTAALVSGAGGEDNGVFEIIADVEPDEFYLAAIAALDFDAQPTFAIRVGVTDNTGARFDFTYEIGPIDLRLNEFAASNTGELVDDVGGTPDWIELYNAGPNALDLEGWSLVDNIAAPFPWAFPAGSVIPGDGYLIVFASDRDFAVPEKSRYHTTFKISRKRCEYLALHSPDGGVVTEFRHTPEIPASLSFGLLDGEAGELAKTPYAPNRLPDPPAPEPLPLPVFDRDSGHFANAFALNVTIPDEAPEDSVVRFTTDGTEPDALDPELVSPLAINATTILRARIYSPDGGEGPAATRSFLFRSDIVAQDTMNLSLVGGAAATLVDSALIAIPSLVVAGDADWLFGEDGLMNPDTGRVAREAALDFFDPLTDDMSEFSTTAGIRLNGRRGLTGSPKQSFRVQFRSEFGDGTLDAPLFGADGPVRFDNLVLRAGFNNSWTHPDLAQRQEAQALRDAFARNTLSAMGGHASRGRFVHLYLNDRYWGIYELTELPDDRFAAGQDCFDERDYDVIDAGEEADGDLRAEAGWADLENLVSTFANPPTAEQIATLKALVDERDLADFLILHGFIGSKELGFFSIGGGEQNNWFASRLAGSGQGFRFHVWDSERSLEDPTENYFIAPNRSLLLAAYAADPELRTLIGDRYFAHTKSGGVLNWGQTRDAYLDLVSLYTSAFRSELARWGDKADPAEPVVIGNWFSKRTYITNTYLRFRPDTVRDQMRLAGLFPYTNAPNFQTASGFHPIGVPLVFDTPSLGGQVYFTLDGSDPRLPGGAIAPTAILATGPFFLAGEQNVSARVRSMEGEWSPLNTERFAFGYSDLEPGALRVSEIMPNPIGSDQYSYIEFYNAGSQAIALGGLTLSGDVEFDFSASSISFLEPGSYLLLVESIIAFEERYGPGLPVAGRYSKSFKSQLGANIEVSNLNGEAIIDFTPHAYAPWPRLIDDLGFSIVPRNIEEIDGSPVYGDPRLWRHSSAQNGSPGRADPPLAEGFTKVIFNEVGLGDGLFVELHNAGTEPVDISGWQFGSDDVLQLHTFEPGTEIPAGGYFLVPNTDLVGELFRNTDGHFTLLPVDAEGTPVGQITTFTYRDPFPGGHSRSPHLLADGTEVLAITEATPAGPNAPPTQNPLIINEFGEDFFEFLNPGDTPLELANAGLFGDFEPFGPAPLPPGGLALLVFETSAPDIAAYRARHRIAAEIPIGILPAASFPQAFALTNESVVNIRPQPGRTAVRIDPTSFALDPASWRRSCTPAGTPGRLPLLSFEEAMDATLPGQSPTLRTPDADPDGDGLSNLLEVAFATDPARTGDVPVSTRLLADGDLELTYRRPHDTFEGIDYILERSADLQTWTPLPESEFTTDETPRFDGTLGVTHTISTTAADGIQQFRVRVEM